MNRITVYIYIYNPQLSPMTLTLRSWLRLVSSFVPPVRYYNRPLPLHFLFLIALWWVTVNLEVPSVRPQLLHPPHCGNATASEAARISPQWLLWQQEPARAPTGVHWTNAFDFLLPDARERCTAKTGYFDVVFHTRMGHSKITLALFSLKYSHITLTVLY